MRPTFDDEDDQERKSTEVTLGLPTLLALFLGLVIICGIFFGFGYSLGRGNAHSNNAANPTAETAVNPPATSLPAATDAAKPAPAQQAAPATASTTDTGQTGTGASTTEETASTSSSINTSAVQQGAAAAASYNQAQTQAYTGVTPAQTRSTASTTAAPAMRTVVESTPQRASQAQPMAVRYTPVARPAVTPPTQSYMVQIAAMRRSSDAAILVNALRARGYPAMTHYSLADGLTHVQIGPFSSYHAAHSMESRLINDGYNAILER